MEAVTRLKRLGLTRTLRVVAVVVVARLARCAWWLWLGSHDARAAGGAAGASQHFDILVPYPENIYLLGCRTGVKSVFIDAAEGNKR